MPLVKTPSANEHFELRTSVGAVANSFLTERHAKDWHKRHMDKWPNSAKLYLFRIVTTKTEEMINE